MDDEDGKALEAKKSLSHLLPSSMWPKKRGSASSHDKFFSSSSLGENDPVIVVRLDNDANGNESFRSFIARLGIETSPFHMHVPDKEKLQKVFDLAASELNDVDKAVTIRVASKECM